ncbi:MAG: ATP-binding protein [Elusimicrobiota bacterium]|nr:MAG: ATP-binding protein [Elusimicrobiota bacterium]
MKILIDSIPHMIFVKNAKDLRFVMFNRAGEDLLGYRHEELIGKNDYDFFPRAEADFFTSKDRVVLEQKKVLDIPEEIIQTRSGPRILHTKKIPIYDSDGAATYLLGISEDITERKKAEAALSTMQKLESLGTLAAGIAHDFNNILTVILGNLSLLRSELKSAQEAGSESLELIEDAEKGCRTGEGLARQLLTFAQGGSPDAKAIDLRPLLEQEARFAARGSNVRCMFDLGSTPLPAKVDENQITQVIHNLVINAAQAMPRGGEVAIQAALITLLENEITGMAAGRCIRLTVSDQGPGIPAEILPRIFEPFYSTKAEGRGLGLSIIFSIMRKHGGHITAESRAQKGAAFTLYLPASDEMTIAPERAPRASPGNGKILIMDDEPLIAKTLKRILESMGYRAESVGDGQAALEAYRNALEAGEPFNVVIMDLTIPGGMGGREAMAKLKALYPDAKALVSSGYSADPVMSEWAAHGFSGALSKPYQVEQVSQALRDILDSPG